MFKSTPVRRLHTLLFESSLAGHGFDFIRLQVPAFLEYGAVTLCTLPESLENPVFLAFAEKFSSREFFVDASVKKHYPAGWRNLWYGYSSLVRAVRKHKPDLVFITSGANFIKALSLFKAHWLAVRPSGCRVEVILFRVSGAYPSNSAKRRLKNRLETAFIARSPVDKVHVSDILAFKYLLGKSSVCPDKINMCPDPIEIFPEQTKNDVTCVRRELGVPTDGRLLGCAGVIDERKGIPQLLDAFAQAPLRGNDRLLLAGQMSPAIRELISTTYSGLHRLGRIICLDRFLSKDEFDLSLLAMDVVCTPYPCHQGPASILLHAAACHKPVLSTSYGWLGWITERFALGKICNVNDRAEFISALVEILDSFQVYSRDDKVERLLQFHDWHNFSAHITAGARSLLGLDEKPLIKWGFVDRY